LDFEKLATGYGLLEGPRVDECNRLYFCDSTRGGIFRRSPDGAIATLIPGRRGAGGILLNHDGGLLFTGKGLFRWDEASGEIHPAFVEWQGKPIIGLNDLTSDQQGSVYTGSLNTDPFSRDTRIPGSLFRIDPPGVASELWGGIDLSNGIGFSPDGRLLYHSDSTTRAVWVYDVAADRTVRDRRIFAKLPAGFPDGLALDVEGGVWVAAALAGEIVHFRSDSTVAERFELPIKMVTSLTFGGPDMLDLYIVTAGSKDKSKSGTVFRARSEIPGLPVPKTRF
jgi:D-xylonolactonase